MEYLQLSMDDYIQPKQRSEKNLVVSCRDLFRLDGD